MCAARMLRGTFSRILLRRKSSHKCQRIKTFGSQESYTLKFNHRFRSTFMFSFVRSAIFLLPLEQPTFVLSGFSEKQQMNTYSFRYKFHLPQPKRMRQSAIRSRLVVSTLSPLSEAGLGNSKLICLRFVNTPNELVLSSSFCCEIEVSPVKLQPKRKNLFNVIPFKCFHPQVTS